MEDIVVIYKPVGETPLEALERFRAENHIPKEVPMTYAGRLDPMAEGWLLILIGEKCKDKDQYTGLDKAYQFEVLLGFSTDTYDTLGLFTKTGNIEEKDFNNLEDKIKKIVENSIGTYEQKYPAYSSKTISGTQMFALARKGELDDSNIPSHEVEIKNIGFLGSRKIVGAKLLEDIITNVRKVHGDFRQEEILEKWQSFINAEKNYLVLKFEVSCIGGFYVRAFTNEISQKLDVELTTFSIIRTKIGDFDITLR